MAFHKMCINLETGMVARIDSVIDVGRAHDRRVTRSDVVRAALEEFFSDPRTKEQVAEDERAEREATESEPKN